MPFNYILTNLLVDVPQAVGAILVDPEGEAVEWVTRHNDPFDLKVEGAYHSIFMRQFPLSIYRHRSYILWALMFFLLNSSEAAVKTAISPAPASTARSRP